MWGLILSGMLGVPGGMFSQQPPGGAPPAAASAAQRLNLLSAKHCAGCHPVPRPGSMTRANWQEAFELMVRFMHEKNLPTPQEELNDLFNLYYHNSPIEFERIPDDFADIGGRFQRVAAGNPPKTERPQATNVNVTDLDQDGKDDFLACDNANGAVSWVRHENGEWTETEIFSIPAPGGTAVFDFEKDGDLDIVVSSMGYMRPNDELIGEAYLLVNRGDQTFEPIGLARGMPRITDVKPADFDGDGDYDFVLAMFGWRTTGGIAWIEQVDPKNFRFHKVLDINGPMKVEVGDLNGDGRTDFVVLVTQQHEAIGLFENLGNGQFGNRLITQAKHPSFGSSGIDLVDLDRDGDLDILYTNGDMMDDNSEWKPYHGVSWVENRIEGWALHRIALLPGCYAAEAADMDGDGDLDVVASAMNFHWPEYDMPSLVLLENDGTQRFSRHSIAHDPSNLVSCAIGDLNHDGTPDIVAAGMHVAGPLQRTGRLTAWFQKPGGDAPKKAE